MSDTANFTYVGSGGLCFERDANNAPISAVCEMACTLPAKGIITGPLLDLQYLVSASQTFQTATGSGGQEIAANRVILQAATAETMPPRPFALVSFRPGSLRTDIVKGYFTSGTLYLSFEMDVNSGLDACPNQAMLQFGQFVENVIQEIWEQVGTGQMGLQLIRAINLTQGPEYSSWGEENAPVFVGGIFCRFRSGLKNEALDQDQTTRTLGDESQSPKLCGA